MICKKNYIKLESKPPEKGYVLTDCIEISERNTFLNLTDIITPPRYLYFTFSNKSGYTNDETYKPY